MANVSGKWSRANYYSNIVDPQGVSITDVMSFNLFDFKTYLIDKYIKWHHVSAYTEGLPDLISYIEYGTEDYWWILCIVNEITDPMNEITAGKNLIIPSISDIEQFVSANDKITNTGLKSRLFLL